MPVVSNHQSIQAGILADFKDFWRQGFPVFKKQQERMCRVIPPNNLRTITEVWKESVPFPEYWAYGAGRKVQTFKDINTTLGKCNYELTIGWSRFDEEDDQLGDLRTHIQSGVGRYKMLTDALIAEYLNNSASLNPAILNAYDGAVLISTTDGDGAARFGVTGGNLVDGAGNTPDGLIHDLAIIQQRLLAAVDPTAGKPIFSPEDAAYSKMLCIVPKELNELFQKTAESENIKLASNNMVSESNYMKGKFEWEANNYLTDTSDWFVVIQHSFFKPLMLREPSAPEVVFADMSNSDSARDTGEYKAHSHVRTAIGPFFPFSIFKVNN